MDCLTTSIWIILFILLLRLLIIVFCVIMKKTFLKINNYTFKNYGYETA